MESDRAAIYDTPVQTDTNDQLGASAFQQIATSTFQ
jgi:hypothetical protein